MGLFKKKTPDPRIDTIINTVEQQKDIIDIPHLALLVNIEEQECKNIIAGYIRQQVNLNNLLLHQIEPRFFMLVYGIREFVEDEAIQKQMARYCKMKGIKGGN
jgi:hypothetical protein